MGEISPFPSSLGICYRPVTVDLLVARNVLKWLRKRKPNPLTALVTTSQVRNKWKQFFTRKPSRYVLKLFRNTNGLQVVFDKEPIA